MSRQAFEATTYSQKPPSPGSTVTIFARLSQRLRAEALSITLSVNIVSCQILTDGEKRTSLPTMSKAGIITTKHVLRVKQSSLHWIIFF